MFLKYKSLDGREAYDYYRKHRTGVAPGLNQYNNWKKAIGGLMQTLRESLVECEGGVYIQDWGYFMNVMHLKKRYRKGKLKKTRMRDFEKYYHYTPHFRPEEGFEKFGFDRSFFEFEVKRRIRLKAKAGYKYKFHLELPKSMEAARTQHLKWHRKGRTKTHLNDD